MVLRHLIFVAAIIAVSGCKNSLPLPGGTVSVHKIKSEYLDREIDYTIYSPPSIINDSSIYLLYLLHGHGGDHMDWFEPDEGNIAYLLDSLIQNKHIPPIRAVSLNAGNSWYVDRQERMNSFYLSEFIPFIEHTYAENTKQISRIIAGNSAGGYGALRFAFQKPHLFKTVLLLSPAAYDPLPPAISSSRKIDVFAMDGSFNDSVWTHFSYTNLKSSFLNAPSHPKFYISVGDDDAYTIVPVVTSIQQFFVQNQVENELRITDGGHDWNCWRDNFTSALVDSFSE